jgi:hypothetical protein
MELFKKFIGSITCAYWATADWFHRRRRFKTTFASEVQSTTVLLFLQ